MSERTFIGLDVHARSVRQVCSMGSPARSGTSPRRWPPSSSSSRELSRHAGPRPWRGVRPRPGARPRGRPWRMHLMRYRHRLSTLLLRRGLVWEDRTWTQPHQLWPARQRFAEAPLQLAYEEALAAMLAARERRDALDRAIAVESLKEPWAGVGRAPVLPARRLDAHRLRLGGRDRPPGGAVLDAACPASWASRPRKAPRGRRAARVRSPQKRQRPPAPHAHRSRLAVELGAEAADALGADAGHAQGARSRRPCASRRRVRRPPG